MRAIETEELSKIYTIGDGDQIAASLKESITNMVRSCGRKILFWKNQERGSSRFRKEEFCALDRVSVSIEQGDKVALLGRNGAGKSTFLKILSRITSPTSGRISVRGRVSSLLEVGAGFHPDLTGRENIFLNGAILGMKYREMKAKFDEIVAFSDIEKFLDVPMKRYSSGMFTRLGFSIAVHLDSEIMIMDEVLAVGDAQFQEKCLKKLNEIGNQHRTILFVSHHISAVMALCNKGMYLEKGKLLAYEPIEECVSRYARNCPVAGFVWTGSLGDEHICVTRCELEESSSKMGFFYHGEKTFLVVEFEILQPRSDLMLGFSILNAQSQSIARSRLCDHPEYRAIQMSAGKHQILFALDFDLFHPGEYQIQIECSLLNKKKILDGEILLKFAVYSQDKQLKIEQGVQREGISLGNRWAVHSNG